MHQRFSRLNDFLFEIIGYRTSERLAVLLKDYFYVYHMFVSVLMFMTEEILTHIKKDARVRFSMDFTRMILTACLSKINRYRTALRTLYYLNVYNTFQAVSLHEYYLLLLRKTF